MTLGASARVCQNEAAKVVEASGVSSTAALRVALDLVDELYPYSPVVHGATAYINQDADGWLATVVVA